MKFFMLSYFSLGIFPIVFGFNCPHSYKACFSLSCTEQVTGKQAFIQHIHSGLKMVGHNESPGPHNGHKRCRHSDHGHRNLFLGYSQLWTSHAPLWTRCNPAMPWILRDTHTHSPPIQSYRQSSRFVSDCWAVLIYWTYKSLGNSLNFRF